MKTIDKLVLKGFIPPYIMAFLIAEFVLVMQFLWKYIDEIIGKGVSIGVLAELIFYFAVTIIPLAIPITLLISSVMVFGNMSEKHELSSFKSAGVSLFRIMAGGILLSIFTALFSLLASNYLKPNANYQFLFRFNSIRKQKPALSIEEGVFNNDFKDFVIRVGEKDENGEDIRDVLIYDHSTDNNLINVVSANTGKMYSSEGGTYFVMQLENGEQIRENTSEYDAKSKEKSYPLVRTKFEEWIKVFDMSQFELEALDINVDRKKYDLLNAFQLNAEIDSFDVKKKKIVEQLYLSYDNLYTILDTDQSIEEIEKDSLEDNAEEMNKTVEEAKAKVKTVLDSVNAAIGVENSRGDPSVKENIKQLSTNLKSNQKVEVIPKPGKRIEDYESIIDFYSSESKRHLNSVPTTVIRKKDMYASKQRELKSNQTYRNIYQLRLHQQFSWAMICMIFLFIGAPLGSIIRKGGYGYPLLIAIVFFMLFIIMNIMGEKLNKSESLHPILAAWLPCIVLSPFALFLTYKAIRDAKLNQLSANLNIFNRFRKLKE